LDILNNISIWLIKIDVPKFPLKLDNVNINEGQVASFVCKYISKPAPINISWFKNDTEELVQTENIIITNEENTTILKLVDAKLSDSGNNFSVKITNELGEAVSNKAKLNVSSGPAFIVEPSNINVLKEKEARFECIIKSNPKPTVSWFFNEKELTVKDGVRVEKDVSKDKYTLVIPKVNQNHLGKYTVKAINEFGSDEKSCDLNVLDVPRIINKLENLTVNENDSVKLSIQFSGKPKPTVTWYKDETIIIFDETIESIETNDYEVTLTIKSCKSSEHTGNYYAKIVNEYGEINSNKATLTINS
jgi:hypothetical protein